MKQVLMETVSQVKPTIDKKNNEVYFEGIFGLAGKRNLNGRIYPLAVMEKAVKDYNKNFIEAKRGLGELDHPEDASVNLRNAAFIIEDNLKINEKGEVMGKARILEGTPMGNIAATLMRQGVIIGLSSRGLGEIAEKEIIDEETGENVKVNEVSDFSIASFDLVSEPSIGKFVNPVKEKEAVEKPIEKQVTEKRWNAADLINLSETLFDWEVE